MVSREQRGKTGENDTRRKTFEGFRTRETNVTYDCFDESHRPTGDSLTPLATLPQRCHWLHRNLPTPSDAQRPSTNRRRTVSRPTRNHASSSKGFFVWLLRIDCDHWA